MSIAPQFVRLGAAPEPSWLDDETVAATRSLEPNPFDDAEFAGRVQRISDGLARRELDGVLVFRPSSVDYICGHHTIETAPQPVLVSEGAVRLYVPDPEVGRALASTAVDTVAHYAADEDALDLVAADVRETCGVGARIAVEDRDASVPPRVLSLLEHSGLNVEAAEYLVEKLRHVLSPAEISCMDKAAEVTARGVAAAREAAGEPAATDSSLAASVARALRENADSSAAMDVIVATGERAGVPHSTFRDVALADAPTFVEFAGTHHRYHAPVMVTVARQVDSTARRLEGLSQTMLAAVLEEARPGRTAADAARAIQSQLTLESGDIFHFNFGYIIGLAHPPGWLDGAPFSIVVGNEAELKQGMAFHLPASFRSFAHGGVGLSHTVVLDADGPRILTGGDHVGVHLTTDG